jgi:hypothetical protein
MAARSDRTSRAAAGGGADRGREPASGSRDATRVRTAPNGGGEHGRRPPLTAIVAVPFVVALALSLFAWPAAELAPRDLPVGVAGPMPAVRAIQARLRQPEGAFDVHRYRDAAAARAAIGEREVYGAFVASPGGVAVMTASAGSPVVARLLREAAGDGAQVRDVVPTTAEDPLGLALGTVALPLVIGGIVTGVLAGLIAPLGLRRLALLLAGAIFAGLVAVAILQAWLGVIRGSWLANAGALSLAVLAIAATVAGLEALIGPPGIAVAALLMVLIGNPFSGIASAPEMLPRPAGTIGQLMPPGASGNLLRSTAFFDGAAAAGHAAVLAAWALLGLCALAVAARR